MSVSIISFTENGISLSEKLTNAWDGETIILYTKCTAALNKTFSMPIINVEQTIGEWAKEQMREKNTLLFIGACGIAVRAIAPCLTDKLNDSPVLVMDERGEYIIPILSGHMGGANEIAMRIAGMTGATPVITTATDINEKFAVDLFAKRNGLHIVNKDGIAKVSAKVLAGKEITLSVESGHIRDDCRLPMGMHMVPYPPKQAVDIVVTTENTKFEAAILLMPKEYIIGMGCRRGKEAEKIEDLITRSMEEAGILLQQIRCLASIEQKKDEQGLLSWSRKNKIPFITYTAEQLQEVEGTIHTSAFVKDRVGVDNVCERAALKACEPKGELIYEKHAEDGMTIAIAKREWRVDFDEK